MREQFDTRADLPQPKGAVDTPSLAPSSEKPSSESAIWSEFMRRTLADESRAELGDDDQPDAAPAY